MQLVLSPRGANAAEGVNAAAPVPPKTRIEMVAGSTAFVPPYAYTLDSAASIPAIVRAGAGPGVTRGYRPQDGEFKGRLDDLAVFNRAYGYGHAAYLYNNGTGNPAPSVPDSPP